MMRTLSNLGQISLFPVACSQPSGSGVCGCSTTFLSTCPNRCKRFKHLFKPSRKMVEQGVIVGGLIMANSLKTARCLVESRLRDAARGDSNACFDLGIFYSTGTGGESIDLVEAHKWFNQIGRAACRESVCQYV